MILDQDGPLDEAIAADGSQPEFDFDDIEAPAPALVERASEPATAATIPVAIETKPEPTAPSSAAAAASVVETVATTVETTMVETTIAPAETTQPAIVEASAPMASTASTNEVPAAAVVIEVATEVEAAVEPAAHVEIAEADAAEDVAAASPVEPLQLTLETPADEARSRAEQLRGLFDSARQDTPEMPTAPEDSATTEASRSA